MSVIPTMAAVIRYALTLQAHFSAAAMWASPSPVMEGLVWIMMSVWQVQITASKLVSIHLADSGVSAILDSRLIWI